MDRLPVWQVCYPALPNILWKLLPSVAYSLNVWWHRSCSSPLQRRGFRCRTANNPASEEAGYSRSAAEAEMSTELRFVFK